MFVFNSYKFKAVPFLAFERLLERRKDLQLMPEKKSYGPMQEFLNKFFELCKEYQEQIPPDKIAEVLRDYAKRLDG